MLEMTVQNITRRMRGSAGWKAGGVTALAALVTASGLPAAHAADATIQVVSRSTSGVEGDGPSTVARVSGDGRFVVFESSATNLVAPAPPAGTHIYLRDTRTNKTTLVSKRPDGTAAQGGSRSPSISADGSVIAFTSTAKDLVLNDTNNTKDVFVFRSVTGRVTRIDTNSGSQPNGPSDLPVVSGDGSRVAFASDASNYVQDKNGQRDVFVHEIVQNVSKLVSMSRDRGPADGRSDAPAISHDGRTIAFESTATDLVRDDTNSSSDVFVSTFRDPSIPDVTRVSVSSTGVEGDAQSTEAAISGDGNVVAFTSVAGNLVADDTNNRLDVFRRRIDTGFTGRVSRGLIGAEGNGNSSSPSVNFDGTRIAFTSSSTNLSPNDENGATSDVFLFLAARPPRFGQTLISQGLDGTSGNHESVGASISSVGDVIAFISRASNLVAGQQNDNQTDAFIRIS